MFANTTPSGSGRGFALAASAFATFVLFPAVTVAAEESKSDTIGPWKFESVFKVDRCSINRTLKDDIVVTFVRTGEGLKSRTPVSELEARRRQALSGEDDAWSAQHRHRSRRQAKLRLDRNQGREICGGASPRKRA